MISNSPVAPTLFSQSCILSLAYDNYKAHLDALLSRFILPCIHSFTHTPFEALLEAESVSNRVFPLVLVGFIQQLIIREFVHDGFVDAVERKSSVGTRLDRQHDHGGV